MAQLIKEFHDNLMELTVNLTKLEHQILEGTNNFLSNIISYNDYYGELSDHGRTMLPEIYAEAADVVCEFNGVYQDMMLELCTIMCDAHKKLKPAQ